MPELVRIAHSVDRHHAPVADIERRDRVDCAARVDHDKAGQPVEPDAMNGLRRRQVSGLRQAFEEADNLVAAIDGIERRGPLATAVGIEDGVLGKKLGELRRIAGHEGAMKCVGQPRRLVLRHPKPRPRLPRPAALDAASGSVRPTSSIGLPAMFPRRAAKLGCSNVAAAALSASRSSSVISTITAIYQARSRSP
jgi:hypothetical protein